jgi:hypothetical protein
VKSTAAARKAAERSGKVPHVYHSGGPYAKLAIAALGLAAEDAKRDDELAVRAKAWLARITAGEPGWWQYVPGFDAPRFARRVIELTRTRMPPRASPESPMLECYCYEQCTLPFAS